MLHELNVGCFLPLDRLINLMADRTTRLGEDEATVLTTRTGFLALFPAILPWRVIAGHSGPGVIPTLTNDAP